MGASLSGGSGGGSGGAGTGTNLSSAFNPTPTGIVGAALGPFGYLGGNLVNGASNNPIPGMANSIGANGGVLGLPGGSPQQANVQQGTTVGDVQGAQQQAGNSLQSQQALLQALQGQNGLGAQSNLQNQLQAANGVGTQNQAIQGLQGAAGQYQNIANGTGPNPAQAMLNQATGQNVTNQAALMAGQRGAGANVGLMARQASQQGANTQQQAAGQAATMQANQQIAGLQGLVGAQQAVGNLGSSQVGAQQTGANTIAGQQIAGTQANTQANLAQEQQMQNSLQGINSSNVASQASVNAGNVGLAQANQQAKAGIVGGAMNSIGSILSAGGGMVPHMAEGGPAPSANGATSSYGQFLNGWTSNQQNNDTPMNFAPTPPSDPYDAKGGGGGGSGGGSGLGAIAGIAALAASKGGVANTGGPVKAKAPDQKAVKSGNSYANDKIDARLSEGEIVLPRSVTMSGDPANNAAKFVAQVLAKKRAKS